MAAKDIIHKAVKNALINDGWTITHDPLHLKLGRLRVLADLGAEKAPIAAEKAGRKIAVEVKSFVDLSLVDALEKAIGQFELYRLILSKIQPDRILYLAVTKEIYAKLLVAAEGEIIVQELSLRLIVVDRFQEEIVQWIE